MFSLRIRIAVMVGEGMRALDLCVKAGQCFEELFRPSDAGEGKHTGTADPVRHRLVNDLQPFADMTVSSM